MPDVQDLWALASALKTSLAFEIALPILVALVFANIADRLEGYLTSQQSPQEAETAEISRPEIAIGPARRRMWSLSGGDVRSGNSA